MGKMENQTKMHDRRLRLGDLAFRVRSTVSGATDAGTDTASDPGHFVLIHGLGTSHRSHQRLHTELARTQTVHSIDLPGFGELPTPTETVDIVAMARALARVLDRLGITQAVVVGHSMGAQWVVELAGQRPDLVARVIVVGPVSDPEHRTAREHSLALCRDVVKESFDANAVVFTDYLRCRQSWYLAQMTTMLSYPIEQRIARLSQPVLVLRGGKDPVAGESWCRRLRDHARFGSLVTVPHHRHVVQFTAPRAVASALLAFVARTRLPMSYTS